MNIFTLVMVFSLDYCEQWFLLFMLNYIYNINLICLFLMNKKCQMFATGILPLIYDNYRGKRRGQKSGECLCKRKAMNPFTFLRCKQKKVLKQFNGNLARQWLSSPTPDRASDPIVYFLRLKKMQVPKHYQWML